LCQWCHYTNNITNTSANNVNYTLNHIKTMILKSAYCKKCWSRVLTNFLSRARACSLSCSQLFFFYFTNILSRARSSAFSSPPAIESQKSQKRWKNQSKTGQKACKKSVKAGLSDPQGSECQTASEKKSAETGKRQSVRGGAERPAGAKMSPRRRGYVRPQARRCQQ